MAKYFTPPPKDEKPYNLTGSILDKIKDNNGMIETKAEITSLMSIIGDKLYKYPYSGLRELYNNEVKACQLAQEQFKTKPHILLSIDYQTRELTLQGFNSLGITVDIFQNVLTHLCRSSNFDRSKTGMFGMGFYAYLKLSDLMKVETYALETNEKYGFLVKSGIGFDPIPDNTIKLDSTGTKITLVLDQSIEIERLIEKFKEFAKFAPIPTYINITGSQNDYHEMIQQSSFRQILKEIITPDLSVIIKRINDDNIEIIAAKLKSKSHYDHPSARAILLCNVPIKTESDTSDYDIILINMKSEEYFKPKPDREELTEEAEKRLDAYLRKVELKVPKIKVHNVNDFYKQPLKWFWLHGYDLSIDDESKKFHRFLELVVKTNNQHRFSNRWQTERIYELLPQQKPKGFILLSKMDTWKYEHLQSLNYVPVVLSHAGYKEDTDNIVIPFEKSGITVPRRPREQKQKGDRKEYVLYTRSTRFNVDADDINEYKNKVYMVKNIVEKRHQLPEECGYYFMRHDSNLTGFKTEEDFVKKCMNITVKTNKGSMKVQDITDKQVYIGKNLKGIDYIKDKLILSVSSDQIAGMIRYVLKDKKLDDISQYEINNTIQDEKVKENIQDKRLLKLMNNAHYMDFNTKFSILSTIQRDLNAVRTTQR